MEGETLGGPVGNLVLAFQRYCPPPPSRETHAPSRAVRSDVRSFVQKHPEQWSGPPNSPKWWSPVPTENSMSIPKGSALTG